MIKLIKGDSYKLIKDIPDRSIDLIYTDIPYKYESAGAGSSALALRIKSERNEALAGLSDGIDYSIFDEMCRVLKNIYIYIYGVPRIRYWI